MKLKCVGITDIGRVRHNNEDNLYINGWYKKEADKTEANFCEMSTKNQYLCAVCDGMGGEQMGEISALFAVEELRNYSEDFEKKVNKYIQAANQRICSEIESNGGMRMGTTFAALYINHGNALCINVGDSRIYQLRDRELRLLSLDHTQAQRLVNQGYLMPVEMRNHKDKHKLTQHLGIFPDEMIIEPHITEISELKSGVIFLLCSDGLTDMLHDTEIEEILISPSTPECRADQLIKRAIDAGGKDNITVIVLEIDEI